MLQSSRIVVGVAGRIGSGKTSVARHFEHEFNFQYLRYSQVLAEWFQTDPEDKRRLQIVGSKVMAGENQSELNRRLIDRIDPLRDVVVDGLRHITDYESLRNEFGSRFFLVYLDTPPNVRFERLGQRFRTYRQFREADEQLVESHIELLRPLAAVILPGTLIGEHLVGTLRSLVLDFRERMVA